MTLHGAITQILLNTKVAMSPSGIANELNKIKLYSKKDGSAIKSSQIGARVKNYPHLFKKEGTLISLKSKTGVQKINAQIQQKKTSIDSIDQNTNLLVKVLMNEKNFKQASIIENSVPDSPGLYCIRISNPGTLVDSFSKVLKERDHNIVYIGIASKSLKKRFLGQELRAKGHGTFFRSLGAVLGYTPEKGSLIGKRNQNNYTFSQKNEAKIIHWINDNLIVNWVATDNEINSIESGLIREYLPLLNIAGNPGALLELSKLRNNCKTIARG
ncbi:GIY-YIG nuclease family protein [Urechidicola vernalis]|uniref:GIY-YIG catalytic domain-containing protein n=1 Tax=Urechidicola vernalis TaxID=3075600 RepID=A0ABU2Y4C2_9FLAO|nr:hypothetical protein [Urechidicola sp. P050]MDT0552115.1 hypothetical protein [Urechidicola sp. P050]